MTSAPTQTEPRAAQTVATASPFYTAAQRGVGRFTSNLVDRLAPDDGGIGARPGGGLSALGYADRVLAPYVRRAQDRRSTSLLVDRGPAGMVERSGESTEMAADRWVFATPWYLDELDWQMAEAATTSSPMGAPRRRQSRSARVWSPMVSAPAARAAELLAATRTGVSVSPSAQAFVPDFTFVSPMDLSEQLSQPSREIPARSATTPTYVDAATMMAAAKRSEGGPASASPQAETLPAPTARDSSVDTAPVFAGTTPSAPLGFAPPLRSENLAPAAGPRVELSVGLRGVVEAIAEQRALRSTAPVTNSWLTPMVRPPVARAARAALSHVARELPHVSGELPHVAPVSTSAGESLAAQVVDMPVVAPDSLESRASSAAATVVGSAGTEPVVGATAASALQSVPARRPTLVTSGYRSVSAAPRAVGHIAWADRWLGRFAGASTQALGSFFGLTPSQTRPAAAEERAVDTFVDSWMQSVVAPDQPSAPAAISSSVASPSAVASTSSAAASAPSATGSTPAAAVPIIGDDETTTPEMFARIAAAAAEDRGVRRGGRLPQPTVARAAASTTASASARPDPRSAVDRAVASVHPSWTEPGLRPELAASPLASSLSATLALEPTTPFDVRAFASTTPLDWFAQSMLPSLARSPQTMELATSRASERAPFLGWVSTPSFEDMSASVSSTAVPSPSSFAAPTPSAVAAPTPSAVAAPSPSSFAAPTPSAVAAPTPSAVGAPTRHDSSVAAARPPVTTRVASKTVLAAAPRLLRPSQLVTDALAGATERRISSPVGESPRGVTESMPWPLRMPMVAPVGESVGRPGAMAMQAARFGRDRSLSSGRLALDFVAPELIMAAKLYGLGPVEAKAATQLASLGPSSIQSAASALDLAFVQLAAPQRASRSRSSVAPTMGVGEPVERPPQRRALAAPRRDRQAGAARTRGAVLWPDAAARALGLQPSDSDQSVPYSRAALDVMAAATVLQLGTPFAPAYVEQVRASRSPSRASTASAASATSPTPAVARSGRTEGWRRGSTLNLDLVAAAEIAEGRSMPLSVRAARALAVAATEDAAPRTPGARAREAFARMPEPIVSGSAPRAAAGSSLQGLTMTGRSVTAPPAQLYAVPTAFEAAPQFGDPEPVSSRVAAAGQSLRSLVAPQDANARSAATRRQGGRREAPVAELIKKQGKGGKAVTDAVMRATGVKDLPPWFEEAARRVLAGQDDGEISFSELVLISTAGPGAMAASEKSAGSSQVDPGVGGSGSGESYGAPPAPDIEVFAREVYDLVMSMFDIARERIGDPWEKV